MSQITQLLLYQQKDSELLAIEQEIAGSEERKKYVQVQSFMKKASDKLDQLDAKSQHLLSVLDSLNKKYGELLETLKDFEHLDELIEGGADLSFYKRNAGAIADELKGLKAEIASLATSAKETTDEYQSLKKKVITTQKQYPEVKAAYQALKESRQGEADKVAAELSKLEKGIDAEVMRRYQAKRAERIFPILCEIKSDRCSKCGIELSLVDKEKASAGKVIECENCHRFLYKK